MSFYDKRALVVLMILWHLSKEYVSHRQDLLLHRLEQTMVYYKIGLKKKDHKWVKFYIQQFQIRLEEYKDSFSEIAVIFLVSMVAEHYWGLVKNKQRLAVWDTLSNYCLPYLNKLNESQIALYEKMENILELLLQDLLYLKIK
jgi:hypothetical protein